MAKLIKETDDGIEVYFEALPEELSLEDRFDEELHDFEKLKRDINSGELVWFCAHVFAIHPDHGKVADDYLGECCYKSHDEFVAEDNGYCKDMTDAVIDEARNEAILIEHHDKNTISLSMTKDEGWFILSRLSDLQHEPVYKKIWRQLEEST